MPNQMPNVHSVCRPYSVGMYIMFIQCVGRVQSVCTSCLSSVEAVFNQYVHHVHSVCRPCLISMSIMFIQCVGRVQSVCTSCSFSVETKFNQCLTVQTFGRLCQSRQLLPYPSLFLLNPSPSRAHTHTHTHTRARAQTHTQRHTHTIARAKSITTKTTPLKHRVIANTR